MQDKLFSDIPLLQIKKQAAPFLKEMRKASLERCLLRGSKKQDGYFEGLVRKDRRSQNTPKAYHEAADDWFEERFSHKYGSASLFCTGSFDMARSYGNVYAIFPIGDKFTLCWSPHIADLYGDVFQGGDSPEVETFAKILHGANYRESDISGALYSENEVMLNCVNYYAVGINKEHEQLLLLRKLGVVTST